MSPRLRRRQPLALACALAAIGSASCEPPPDPAEGQGDEQPIEARPQALFTSTLPTGWSTTPVGSNGLAGSASYDDVTNSFGSDGAGNNVSGTADNFYFVYRTQSGDGEIVARMTGISGGSTSARHGIMIRSSSATNSSHVFLFQQPDQTVGYTRRAGVGTGSFHGAVTAGAKFHWLKLVRRGSTIQSYTSADGLTWTVGLAATLSGLGPTALYGIAVCSYNTGATARSYADNVGVTRLPSPYGDADVGATGASGTASFDYPAQTWTVRGAGAGVAGTSDSFHFAYRTLIGDGELIARVASVSGPSTSRAGIMLRNSLGASSSHAFLWSTPSGGVGLTRRAAGGVSSAHFLPVGSTNQWMRLVRAGATVDGYESPDGVAWTLVASSNLSDLGTTVYVGFADTSRVSGTLSTAVLDSVVFKPVQSQRPNMVPWVGNWQVIPDDVFLPDSHDVQDGCVTAGTHKVLRFDFQSRNHGRTDAVVGQPSQRPDLFVWSLAHQHRHFLDYNRYFLRDASGVVAASKKESFCLEDTDRSDDFGAPDAKFFCANDGIQGIAAGWLDEYNGELPCQYIVLDGVPPGSYTLEATTNVNRFVVEDDYSDNSFALPVVVP
jgi:hypothetical protein